jgi:hypothetical protein
MKVFARGEVETKEIGRGECGRETREMEGGNEQRQRHVDERAY